MESVGDGSLLAIRAQVGVALFDTALLAGHGTQRSLHTSAYARHASHALLTGRASLHDAVADLRGHVGDGPGAVGQEDGLSLGVGRDVAQRLEVLRDEEELRDLVRGELLVAAVRDGVAESVDDGAALPRDALALQLGGVRGRLRRLHDLDLLGLRRHDRRVAEPLLLVDLVHGLHHGGVGHELGHEGLVDDEAVVRHLRLQLRLDRDGDVVLLLERLVDRHVRHRGPDDVRDVGVDLGSHVCELVHGVHGTFRLHGLLHRDLHGDEDVVLRLRAHHAGDLLHAAGDGAVGQAAAADVGSPEGEPRRQHVAVPAELLDGIPLVLGHRHEAVREGEAAALLLRHPGSVALTSRSVGELVQFLSQAVT
mmetsp:Transcript_27554/g.82110  ORF Transcript_27554/g.82110 Transcript_27554/m.82110 type:complete len:366 (-) Transcript_27554:3-1100(-)